MRRYLIARLLSIGMILCLALLPLAPSVLNGVGIYLLLHGDRIGGLLAVGSGLGVFGGVLMGLGTAGTISTIALIGAGIASFGAGILIG